VAEYYEHSVVVESVLSLKNGKYLLLRQAYGNRKSIAGPIIPNYALIDKHNLHIIGVIREFIKI
jgi:prephenate dehydratase